MNTVKAGILAIAPVIVAIGFLTSAVPSSAATQNAEERRAARDTRQDARQGGRKEKIDCRQANQKNNSQCRQDHRQGKQEGRQTARDIKY
jgi:hypothetical protein